MLLIFNISIAKPNPIYRCAKMPSSNDFHSHRKHLSLLNLLKI